MKQRLGDECAVIEENLDELLTASSISDHNVPWLRRKTAIVASDNVTQIMMEHLSPFSVLMITGLVYWMFGSAWPIIVAFIVCFSLCRVCRWLNSRILSKMWLCNVSLFFNRQRKTNCRWIWRDRTCVDVYTYCLLNRATAVSEDFPSILLDQTRETSVAIILDRPRQIIEEHLRRRIASPTTSRLFAVATWLILHTKLPVRASTAALEIVERWYSNSKVPVLKISDIDAQLDHDANTGDINWNDHSVEVLLKHIERAIEKHESPALKTDSTFLPWTNRRSTHLYL
jgi:hypothetical protein